MSLLRWFTALLAILPHASNGFPTGAGGCDGGMAAVGGSHIFSENVETGSLATGNFVVRINGQPLSSSSPMEIPIGVEHEWEISGNDAFRGFLVRLDGGSNNVDTTASLAPNSGQGGSIQVAESVCVAVYGVGGVTHRSRALKSAVSGVLIVDEASREMNLDVTVVVENRNQVSEYYYTGFVLHAVEQAPIPPPQDGDDDDDDDDDDEGSVPVPRPTPPIPSPTNPPPTNPAPTNPRPTNPAPTTPAPTNPPPTNPPVPAPTRPRPTAPPAIPADDIPDDPDDDFLDSAGDVTSAPFSPELEDLWPQCNSNETCGVCQGDCDTDDECEGHLACFQRDEWDETPVPGCEGTGWMGADYCFDPIEHPYALQSYTEDCTAENPCGKCKGDCDDDSHCAGHLECFHRTTGSNNTVPGCYGHGIPGLDYCFDRMDMADVEDTGVTNLPTASPTVAPVEDDASDMYFSPTLGPTAGNTYVPTTEATMESTEEGSDAGTDAATEEETEVEETEEETDDEEEDSGSYYSNELSSATCTPYAPCDVCEGDCDHDMDCSGDLECFPRRVGDYTPVPGCSGQGYAGHDYCYKVHPNTVRHRVSPCTPEEPCLKCQGDCDGNEDCAGNLKCFQRETGDEPFVPGCKGRGVANVDYCFDPADVEGWYSEISKNGNGRLLRARK